MSSRGGGVQTVSSSTLASTSSLSEDHAGSGEQEDCRWWRKWWRAYVSFATAIGRAMTADGKEDVLGAHSEAHVDEIFFAKMTELHNKDSIYVIRTHTRRVLSFFGPGVQGVLTKRLDDDGNEFVDRYYYAAIKWVLQNETIVNSVLTIGSCFFTYAIIAQMEASVSPTLAQLLITVLLSSFYPQYAASFGIGAFAAASGTNIVNYAWLTLQAFSVAIIWIAMIHTDLLKGLSGRLGCGAFAASNFTTLLECASGVVPWTVYFNKDSSGSYLNVTLLRGVTIVVSCPICVLATKIVRTKLILNPVYGAAAAGLTLVLIITCVGTDKFLYAEQAISSIGVGTFTGAGVNLPPSDPKIPRLASRLLNIYVSLTHAGLTDDVVRGGRSGMVSYDYIRSTAALTFVGVIAGFVQIALFPPFSGGFGGWEGVCAAIACFIYLACRWIVRQIRMRCGAFLLRRKSDL